MKRLLSQMLCFLLLCGAIVTVASCKKQAPTVNITDYTLVYDVAFGSTLKQEANALGKRITAATGVKLSAFSSQREAAEKEILIGDTNRPETDKLKSEISGHGYAYGIVDGKPVIVGTTKLLTVRAMQAFAAACLSSNGDDPTLSVPHTVVSDVKMISVSADFAVVYSALLNDQPAPEGSPKDGPDYAFEMAEQLQKSLRSAFSDKSQFTLTEDTKTAAKEILVGLVARNAVSTFLQGMDVNDYGFGVVEGRVVVTGLNDAGLKSAVNAFSEIVTAEVAAAGGERKLLLPADLKWVASRSSEFVTDFPRPASEGVTLSGTVDAGEGSVAYLYTGKGVNPDAYRAYLAALEGAGYVKTQSNEIEGSLFASYTHPTKNQVLYVTYAAFAHAKEQKVTTYAPAIRITAAAADGTGNRFDAALLSPDYGYKKVTDTRVTTLRLNYATAGGMCYVVQLEDGSFMVLDGGYKAGGDYHRLYKVLADLHYRAFGKQPAGGDPIVITAWYLTHSHGDHYQNFVELCKEYGNRIELKYLVANHPSDAQGYNTHDPNFTVRNSMRAIFDSVLGTPQYLKVHTGQRLYFANMELEILYTPEDMYPLPIDVFNNSGVVCRSTFTATDGKGQAVGNTTDLLWLADTMGQGSQYLRAMYGEGLKSDMVQVAHHGLAGAEIALYILVEPEIVLWPGGIERLAEVVSNTNAGGYKKVSAVLYQNLSSVKYHIFADIYNTTVTITKNGPDMSLGGATGLYNAGEANTPIVITEGTKKIGAVVKK